MGAGSDDAALRTAFRATHPSAIRAGLRNAIVLVVGLLPLVALLDWLTRPEHALAFLGLRLADAVVQLALLRLLLREDGERWVRLVGLVGPASASAAVNCMAALTGGPASPYTAGTMIVILCTAILVPWGPASMLLVGVVVTAVGMACALLGTHAGDGPVVISDLAGFAASTVIAVACAALRDRARWRAFRDGRRLADHARLLETIHHAQSRFIADADPHVLFGDLLDTLLGATGSTYGFIGEVLRHDDGRPFLQVRALTDIAWDDDSRRLYEATGTTGFRFERLDSLFGAALTTGQPVIANRPATDPRRGGLPAGHPPLHAFLGLPLYHGTEMIGLAGVANRADGYDDGLVARLAPLGRTIAGLIFAHRNERERRRAEASVAEQAEVAAALARVGATLIASLDTPVLLERLCQVTTQVLDAHSSHTLLWQPTTDAFAPVAIAGDAPKRPTVPPIPREMLAGLLAELEHTDVVDVDHGRVTTFLRAAGHESGRPPGRRLCLALRRGSDIVGIQIAYRQGEAAAAFEPRAVRIAEGIAQLASMALANSRLVEELARASRLKTEFVSTMSHELRTPLNVILGFTEMLRDGGFDEAARAGFVDTIERAGRDLLALIESTLEVGRIESGRQQVRLQPTPLATFWRELEATCGMLPRTPAVTLEWSAAPAEVTLVTDPHKLAIVLRNLIGNALKFTERGAVRADVEGGPGTVSFRIRDTGIGIAPADHGAIFEMFRQADGSDTRRFGGTGLGLYIVRRFVELLGGDVALDSTPGRGSTFTVTLPVRLPAVGPGATRARAA